MTQEEYPTDFRALCAELLCSLEQYPVQPPRDRYLIDRARAALAQPEPHAPADAELLELMPETMRDAFSYAAKASSDATGGEVGPGIFRVALNTAVLEYAQAVLARYVL
jgi:hypothetical protein